MYAHAASNDTRGWIMTALSGGACVLGASIICIDIVVQQIPHAQCRKFRIQDSDVFLSSSLSLTFGVMLFSSLFNMLPHAKSSLQEGGFSPKATAWILIALFLAGAIGIQFLSRLFHHYIPSHVVGCDHTHDEERQSKIQQNGHARRRSLHDRTPPHTGAKDRGRSPLSYQNSHSMRSSHMHDSTGSGTLLRQADADHQHEERDGEERQRRPSLARRVSDMIRSKTAACNSDGDCFGLSTPCGQDCFKAVQARGRTKIYPPVSRSASIISAMDERQPLLKPLSEAAPLSPGLQVSAPAEAASGLDVGGYCTTSNGRVKRASSKGTISARTASTHSHHYPDHHHQQDQHEEHIVQPPADNHHHHVPTNAFLSIGLQTCIAIALHKLPEGFITYATNHANPKLGLSVFIALFIHNITEGFAIALPLYLAIHSRSKAMIWAAILGGFSQPLGAAIAALWFKVAGSHPGVEPGEAVYGGMFAIVSGIMTSVALQLFGQSLDLTHNRTLCMVFAFIGMGILGAASALTA